MEIGYWARFVLEERVEKPRPSKPLDLSNSCYVVLKAEGFETPLLCVVASLRLSCSGGPVPARNFISRIPFAE